MGRHAGWLALEGGEASVAYVILMPEHDFSIDQVSELVLEGHRGSARCDIIVVAEGVKPAGGAEFIREGATDCFGHKTLGGGEYVAGEALRGTGIDCRSVVLSHLWCGGAPCAYDRRMGRYFGIAAVDLVVNGDFGRVVSYRNGRIVSVRLEAVIDRPALVGVETQYDTDRYNGRRTILNATRGGMSWTQEQGPAASDLSMTRSTG